MPDAQADDRGESRQSFFVKQQLIGSAKTAFQQAAAVLKNSLLYPEAHPFLLATAEKLVGTIGHLLVGRTEAAFYLVGGELFFETLSVPLDQSLALLMEQFAGREVGGISFKPGLTAKDLIKFAALMNREPESFRVQGGISQASSQEGLEHIELHRAQLMNRTIVSVETKQGASALFMDAVSMVKELVQAVHLDKAINARKMNTVVQTMVDSVLENRDALMGLTSIKMYDEYTFAHSVNASILAISLGTYLSFDKPRVAALGVAGLLHDIGKVSVPIEIINKPDKLSEEEWELIKRHPVEGALALSDIPGVTKLAMIAAFEHHQHGDARSYPWIDDRPQQHPFSQIVAIADAYDALTAARVYFKSRMPPDQAMRTLIKKRGVAFEPAFVKAFVNMIGLFPVGTLLKLDTGEVGLVVHQTRDLMRPRILLLGAFDGSERETGEEVSLLETAGGRYKRSLLGSIDPYAANIDLKKYFS